MATERILLLPLVDALRHYVAIALRDSARGGAEESFLRFILNAFRDDLHAKAFAELDDACMMSRDWWSLSIPYPDWPLRVKTDIEHSGLG